MPTINCPGCARPIAISKPDYAQGFILRCQECGMKIMLQRKAPGSDSMFPTQAPTETLLDMGDTDFRLNHES